MITIPFQTKETKIICTDEKLVIDCYSNTYAENILACARMANNPEYHAPVDGWSEEATKVANALIGRKIIREKYSHMNFMYIIKKGESI